MTNKEKKQILGSIIGSMVALIVINLLSLALGADYYHLLSISALTIAITNMNTKENK